VEHRRDPRAAVVTDLIGRRPDADRPPAGRPPQARSGVAVLVSLLLIGGLAAGGVLGVRGLVGSVRSSADDYTGAGSGAVVVRIHPGDTASDIATALAGAGVVKTAAAFRRAANADERSRRLQPGFYRLKRHMGSTEALALMLDPAALVVHRVTVPEGTTARGIVDLVARSANLPAAELAGELARPTSLGLPAYARGRVEGLLFPATYGFAPGTTAGQALAEMVRRYEQAARDLDLDARARAVGRTPYQVLIVASIVQGEARLPADFPKVAAVIYNRLARGMPLQVDATINYVLPERKGHLTAKDLELSSPYNSYRVTGLPPTPIGSPGEVALRAALSPTPGDLLYFVTIDKAGHNAFTNSYAEFLRLKAIGARNR
jgi:UPF0755 protein